MQLYLRKNKGEVKIIDSANYMKEAIRHKWLVMWPLGVRKYILFTDVRDFQVWRGNNLMLDHLERGVERCLGITSSNVNRNN